MLDVDTEIGDVPMTVVLAPPPPPKLPVAVPVSTMSPTVSVATWIFPVVGVSVTTMSPIEILYAQSAVNSSYIASGIVWVELAPPTKS